ncbi:MAG: hypothetical protein JW749_01745 [Sedimentisphaerales bacterium]|nr:hypothetical protein [Sedimentisphaerales bacterium]
MKQIFIISVFGIAAAAAWADYEIIWHTIDGGGGRSVGGQYQLTGTAGQPDAAYSAGESYELLGGFWPGGPVCMVDFPDFSIFADYWLESGSDLPADLDGDNDVDLEDLGLFVYEWLCYCPYNWPLR